MKLFFSWPFMNIVVLFAVVTITKIIYWLFCLTLGPYIGLCLYHCVFTIIFMITIITISFYFAFLNRLFCYVICCYYVLMLLSTRSAIEKLGDTIICWRKIKGDMIVMIFTTDVPLEMILCWTVWFVSFWFCTMLDMIRANPTLSALYLCLSSL